LIIGKDYVVKAVSGGLLQARGDMTVNIKGNLYAGMTQPLNSEVSNSPFSAKRPEITEQSLLVANSYFQRFSDNDALNEDTIAERGKYLAEQTLKIWQYPGA